MSSKRKLGRRTNHPPDGVAWIWHTVELLASPAWRGQSINCRRLIDFLEIEHLNHGGVENGFLLAPYSQLAAAGIGKRLIHLAIKEAEQRGLVRADRGGRRGVSITEVSRYRLSYMWTKKKVNGLWDWSAPTDEWKLFTASIASPSCTSTPHFREVVTPHLGEAPTSQAIEISHAAVPHEGEYPSISWEGVQALAVQVGAGAARKAASARRPLTDESEGLKALRDIIDLSKFTPSQNQPVSESV